MCVPFVDKFINANRRESYDVLHSAPGQKIDSFLSKVSVGVVRKNENCKLKAFSVLMRALPATRCGFQQFP